MTPSLLLAGIAIAAAVEHELGDPGSRIERHLARVELRLRAAPTPVVTPEQAASRADLLDTLHDYHLGGAWPQPPPGTPVRARPVPVPGGYAEGASDTPVFVDAEGRACAVGALLLHAGEDVFVASVVEADNGAWLHDLDTQRLSALAEGLGMSLAEWAAIQPGYPVTSPLAPPPRPEPLPPFSGECDPRTVALRIRALGPAQLPDGYEACLVDRVVAAPHRPENRVALMALMLLRRNGSRGASRPLASALLAVPSEVWVASHANADMYVRYLRSGPDPLAQRARIWDVVRAARDHAAAGPDEERVARSTHALRMQQQLREMALPAELLEREQVAYRLASCRHHLLEAAAAEGGTVPSPACQAMVVDPAVLAAEAAASGVGT